MGVGLTHGTFIRLVAAGTGLSFRTVAAWTALENGPKDNPLNIGPHNKYGSNVRAAAATIALLRSPKGRAYGYDVILASAGRKDDQQLKAIALSDWNGGPLAPDSVHIEYAAALERTYNGLFPTGKIRIAIGDITVKNPATQIGPAIGLATGGVGNILGKIANTNTWIRVLLVIIGAIALLAAVFVFARELR